MKTFKKAKEIFNYQVDKFDNENTFSVREQKASLNKFYPTKQLYKLYLYNKILKSVFKKLDLFRLVKITNLESTFYKYILKIYTILRLIQPKKINLLRKFFLKTYDFKKNLNFLLIKTILIICRFKFKKILINLKFLIFSKFFVNKIFYSLKIKKKYYGLKNELILNFNDLKKSTFILNQTRKFKNFIFHSIDLIQRIVSKAHWSNKFLKDILQRLLLVLLIYSGIGLLFLFNIYCYLPNYEYLTQKFANSVQIQAEILHTSINSVKRYLQILPILYISLLLKPKNYLLLPQKARKHIVLCAILSLFTFGIEVSQPLVNYLIKATILLLDIYFCQFFIKTSKKLRFLSQFTNLITSQKNLQQYYFSKLFRYRRVARLDVIKEGVYIDPAFRILDHIGYNFNSGRYEQFTEKILYAGGVAMTQGSGKFMKQYLYIPFYLMLGTILVYNCSYYIIYNKQPFIPIVSNLAEKLTPNNPTD